MKSLSEIRHLLVIACQEAYDRDIKSGVHPYAIASYHYEKTLDDELEKHIDTTDWKADNWRQLHKAFDQKYYNKRRSDFGSNDGVDFCQGQWAVGAILNSKQAWATPGFTEAYLNHCLENN